MPTFSLEPAVSPDHAAAPNHSAAPHHSAAPGYGAQPGGYYLWVSGEPGIPGAGTPVSSTSTAGTRGPLDGHSVAGGPVPGGLQTTINFDRVLAPRVTIDLRSRSVFAHGKLERLTYKEFELLAHLVQAPGRVVSRDELYASVWQSETLSDSRTIDVHVRRLREKLDLADHIITVRGSGYKFILTEQIEILAPTVLR